MYCIDCGAEIPGHAKFCNVCGAGQVVSRTSENSTNAKDSKEHPALVAESVKKIAKIEAKSKIAPPPGPPNNTGDKLRRDAGKRAGYCKVCCNRVWLTENGFCPNGHPPASITITNIYSVDPNKTSGQGISSVLPDELRGWNWGAFLLYFWWGLLHNTYIVLLGLLPYVGFVLMFYLGAKGNELAWRNKKWESIEAFKKSQRNWAIVGLCFWGVIILLILIAMAFSSTSTSTTY
jgi:hypothetical protein